MSRAERRLLDIANLLVGGTGLVYAVMKYLMEASDEWAVVNHPWQPHVQHLHVLAAPLLVFAGGVLWKHHVLEKMRGKGSNGRATGLALAVQFIPLVASGYLIQVSVSETWRMTWIWVHLITGGLWILLAMSHRFRSRTNGERGG
jgi:undecaprenyl pyrophosphate phosphatase UppP